MRGAKRKPKVKPQSAAPVGARVAQLMAVAEWRIEVPFFARDKHNRPTTEVSVNHFPPREVGYYSYDDAVALLDIFCQRFTGNGQHPPACLEPKAVEAGDGHVDAAGRPRPPLQFTLKEVDPWVRRLAPEPPPPAARKDRRRTPEDEAAAWLREAGADDEELRFLDL